MNKYYWKVVSVAENKEFKSAIISYGKHSLTYKLGEIVRPILLPGVFCFENRASARKFRKGLHGETKLLKVKAIGKPLTGKTFYNWRTVLYELRLSNEFIFGMPAKTICFNAVKPIAVCH